jgi:hypothetical protein
VAFLIKLASCTKNYDRWKLEKCLGSSHACTAQLQTSSQCIVCFLEGLRSLIFSLETNKRDKLNREKKRDRGDRKLKRNEKDIFLFEGNKNKKKKKKERIEQRE